MQFGALIMIENFNFNEANENAVCVYSAICGLVIFR